MAAAYFPDIDFPVVQLASSDSHWNVMLHASQRLKTVGGWVTRGSSCNGSSGTAFSATPDGVDRWAGKTRLQATTFGQLVWHVLEHPDSGVQVCLATNPGFFPFFLAVAKNKFETAGAWRGGGTDSVTRPTDVTSSPAGDREVVNSTQPSPSAPSGTQYYNMFIREDGRGFFFWYNRQTTPAVDDQTYLFGFFPVSTPFAGDTNPYFVIYSQGNHLATGIHSATPDSPGTSTRQIRGRLANGTLGGYAMLDVNSGGGSLITTQMQTPDPWTGLRLAWPIVLWTNVSGNTFRFCMEDVWLADAVLPSFATRNDLTQYQIGRLLFPWDGVTVKGTDVDMTLVMITGEAPPPDAGIVDPKRFNKGMEKL